MTLAPILAPSTVALSPTGPWPNTASVEPPAIADVLSQLLLAIPLCLLYEAGIIIAALMTRSTAEQPESLWTGESLFGGTGYAPVGDVTEIRIGAEQKCIVSVETESSRLKCLRNSGQRDDWVQVGMRFPRLTAPKPLLRLKEIISFLNNLPNP